MGIARLTALACLLVEVITLDGLGASAPAKALAEKLGLTPESAAARALKMHGR